MIIVLGVIFLILLLLVGGDRGVVSLLALVGNILVFCLMVLAMTGGWNPYVVTLVGAAVINCLTIIYQNGKNKKSLAASVSMGIVMVLLLVVVFLIVGKMHIGGLNEIKLKSDLSMYYSFVLRVNLDQVGICMVLIGLLGAVMDTAVAISSAQYEIYEHRRDLNIADLFQSGMTIGKDILSTTVNTLYFAYIGEALMLFLYLQKYKYSLVQMLNSKAFLQDFTCIMFSAIGCLMVIPITSWVTAKMLTEQEKEAQQGKKVEQRQEQKADQEQKVERMQEQEADQEQKESR